MTYDWWRMCNTMELRSNSSHRQFFLSNNDIQTTSITKDLGAQFESNLKFKLRINDIFNSAHQRSAVIHRSFWSRDTFNFFCVQNLPQIPAQICLTGVVPNSCHTDPLCWGCPTGICQETARHRPIPYTERLTQLGLQSLNSDGFF